MRDRTGSANPNWKGPFLEESRECSRCGVVKALCEFSPTKGTRIGVRGTCKACINAINETQSGEAICPICSKVRMLVGPVYKRFLKKPWACHSCSRKQRWLQAKKNAKQCVECLNWFSPTPRFRDSQKCSRCRCKQGATVKRCVVCSELFAGRKDKLTCSPACQYRMQMDRKYFGGRMKEAIGWETKACQACGRKPSSFQVHHIFGHPDHSRLIVLCAGCHKMIGEMAWRKYSNDVLAKLVALGIMARDKGLSGFISVELGISRKS